MMDWCNAMSMPIDSGWVLDGGAASQGQQLECACDWAKEHRIGSIGDSQGGTCEGVSKQAVHACQEQLYDTAVARVPSNWDLLKQEHGAVPRAVGTEQGR